MKIVINPEFSHLSEYIQNIPKHEYQYDSVLNDSRNLIHKVTVNNIELVIKRFKRPTIANCFIYTYFRKTKARRAYEYALKLESLGIDTAEPIAYIEIKKSGFFHTGYFISYFLPYPVLDEVRGYEEADQKTILKDLAAFTVELHEKGVAHYDYNNGNILFYKKDNKPQYQFALIDINRMYFGHLSTSRCVRAVKTLYFSLPVYSYFIELYTKQRGFHTEMFFGRVLLKRSLMLSARIKGFFKRLIGRK